MPQINNNIVTVDRLSQFATALSENVYTKDEVDEAISQGGGGDLSDYYTKTETNSLLNNKVDVVSGKGLSSNDYTTTEKNKLAGIAAGAQVNAVTSVNGQTGAVTVAAGPTITAGTSGMTDGVTALATGAIYFQYQ